MEERANTIEGKNRMVKTIKSILLIGIMGAGTSAMADWTQFQGNAAHTGYVHSPLNAPTLAPLWTFREQVNAVNYHGSAASSAAIVDGSVFVTTRDFVSHYAGHSGELVWQNEVPFNPTSPTVHDGTVYVNTFLASTGSYSYSPPAIIGFNDQTGVKTLYKQRGGQWSTGTRITAIGSSLLSESEVSEDLHVWNTAGVHQWFGDTDQQDGWIPAANETHVYVYQGATGGHTGALYVWNLHTGVKEATIPYPRSWGNSYNQSVVLGTNNNALAITEIGHPAGKDSQTLVNFDLKNNAVAWEFDGDFNGPLAAANGIIAVADDDVLRILDEITGTTLWTWNGERVVGNVAMTDRYAFVNAGYDEYRRSVHAIDLISKQSVWNSQGISGHIAIDGQLLVITNGTGVHAYGAVPEPTSLTLLVPVVGVAVAIRRFRKNRSAASRHL